MSKLTDGTQRFVWNIGSIKSMFPAFWTWPFMILAPPHRGGDASHSVMASSYKRGKSTSQYVIDKGFLPGDLPIMEYARLQGAEDIGARLVEAKASRAFACHVLGNGVPIALGRYVARAVRQYLATK